VDGKKKDVGRKEGGGAASFQKVHDHSKRADLRVQKMWSRRISTSRREGGRGKRKGVREGGGRKRSLRESKAVKECAASVVLV